MAGTVVRDATGPNLATGLTLTAGTDTGDVVDLQYPCHFAVELVTGTATGTGNLDVTIQAADDSGFSTNVVTLGKFATLTDANDNVTRVLKLFTNKRYVRASATVSGTGVFTGTTLKVVPFFDRHTTTLSA